MKRLRITFILFLILINFFCSSNLLKLNSKQNLEKIDTMALKTYEEFLKGKRKIDYNNKKLNIIEFMSSEKETNFNYNIRYSLFDTNDDEIPELHVRSKSYYYILTYKNNNLIVWTELAPYYNQLNDGAFLYIRPGGTPSHIIYSYIIMDVNGDEMIKLRFEKYDVDENGYYENGDQYFFEDVNVSMEEWNTLTHKYLSIGSEQIKWINYSDNK